jgi:hypothetical protein
MLVYINIVHAFRKTPVRRADIRVGTPAAHRPNAIELVRDGRVCSRGGRGQTQPPSLGNHGLGEGCTGQGDPSFSAVRHATFP